MFEITLMWPKTKNYSIISFLSTLISISLMTFMGIGLYNNIEFSLKTIDKDILNISMLISVFQTNYKAALIFYKSKDIYDILDNILLKFWPYDLAGEKLKMQLRKFYYVVIGVCLGILITGVLCTHVLASIPLLAENKRLPFDVKYSFDYKKTPIFELLYVSHIISHLLIMITCAVGMDVLFITISASAITQFRILQRCLLVYNTDEMIDIDNKLKMINGIEFKIDNYDMKRDYFIKCVRHHQLLLKFTTKINNIFNLVVLLQLLCSISGICLGIYLVAKVTDDLKSIMLPCFILTGYLEELAFYCVIGNELNYQASLLPEYIYNSNWRQLKNKELKKDVMFMLQESQQTVKLSTYGLYDLNLTSFLKVLKLSFSFYTVLSGVSK